MIGERTFPCRWTRRTLGSCIRRSRVSRFQSWAACITTTNAWPRNGNTARNMLSHGPLTNEETEELDQFLLDAEGIEESMDISTLDGFLTAIVCGPKTIMPSEWLPWVWDMERGKDAPE